MKKEELLKVDNMEITPEDTEDTTLERYREINKILIRIENLLKELVLK